MVLEYNADILEKIEQAVQYGDLLRLYSARNLTERYDRAETAQYQKIYGCLEAETKFADSQYAIATRLREEMYAYAEMAPEESHALSAWEYSDGSSKSTSMGR